MARGAYWGMLAWTAATLAGLGPVEAQDRFFQRMSPFPSRHYEPASVAQQSGLRVANGRVSRPVQGNVGLERSEVQGRLVRQGVAPATLNQRLGKMYGVDPSGGAVANRSVGAGVGRIGSWR